MNRARLITGKAKLAGVMGWPVEHSRSPQLHNYWLHSYAIDGAYVPLAVRPEDLAPALAALPKLGFRGCNITLPHKQAALHLVDEADELARRIGAVNTVVVADDGHLQGSNTDAFGFTEALRAGAPALDLTAAPAVLIGAGGAARAIAVALLDAGVPELRLVNRTLERAHTLQTALDGPVQVVGWEDRAASLEGAGLVVNSTSLGMTGQPPLELSLTGLPTGAVVMDAVYVPLETPLLSEARQRGHTVVDGLGMLLHQARPGFASWFGQSADVTPALRAHVLAGLEA